MSWLPERLVTIGWFGTSDLAAPEKAKLDAAGISSYLGGEHHRHHGQVELRVAESEVERAREILGIEEDAPSADEPVRRCPDCGSDQGREIPPYAFNVLIGAFGLGFVVCLLTQSPIGAAVLLPAWLAAMWLSRYSGKRRCAACGRTWKP